MQFPAKKKTGCPNVPRDFPPRKDGILHPPSGCLGTPLPLPQSLHGRVGGRTHADVTTKISRIDTLPNLLSNCAPLTGFALGLRYKPILGRIMQTRKRSRSCRPHKPYTYTNCRPFKLCPKIHVFPIQRVDLRTERRSSHGEPCLRGYC